MPDPRDVSYADKRMMPAGELLDGLIAAARDDIANGERSDSLAALHLSENIAHTWRDHPNALDLAADIAATAVYRFALIDRSDD